MGAHANIDHDSFPTQSAERGDVGEVMFHNDDTNILSAIVVRDDTVAPNQTILMIEEDNPRLVLATECQFRIPGKIDQWVDRS